MIERLKIAGLFSAFDYDIPVPLNGNAMIITGPNGYGKTTVLSIIDAICNLDFLYFYSIPFNSIEVFYEKYILLIESKKLDVNNTEDDLVELHFGINFTLFERNTIDDKVTPAEITFSTNWDRISGIYEDIKSHQRPFYLRDYDKRPTSFNDQYARIDEWPIKLKSEILNTLTQGNEAHTNFMIVMRSLAAKAKFIPAQRIISGTHESAHEIQRVAVDLSKYLERFHYTFLSDSQSHDAKFITRLMGDEGTISAEEYERRITRIESVNSDAMKFDLTGKFYIPIYSDSKSEILKSYIEDLEEKLSSLNAPIKDLKLFSRLLDMKKFVGKYCIFSRTNGIQFISDKDMSVIPLTSLSSGEINQIIMLFEFIFNLADDSILIIDEPEISLHVVWQHEFMKDISAIIAEKNLSVIIATHSPQIIGSRWKECFDLYAVTNS